MFKLLLNATYVILHTKLLRSKFGLVVVVEGVLFVVDAVDCEIILVSQIIATLTMALTRSDFLNVFWNNFCIFF